MRFESEFIVVSITEVTWCWATIKHKDSFSITLPENLNLIEIFHFWKFVSSKIDFFCVCVWVSQSLIFSCLGWSKSINPASYPLPIQQQCPCSPSHQFLHCQYIIGRVSGVCPAHHDKCICSFFYLNKGPTWIADWPHDKKSVNKLCKDVRFLQKLPKPWFFNHSFGQTWLKTFLESLSKTAAHF